MTSPTKIPESIPLKLSSFKHLQSPPNPLSSRREFKKCHMDWRTNIRTFRQAVFSPEDYQHPMIARAEKWAQTIIASVKNTHVASAVASDDSEDLPPHLDVDRCKLTLSLLTEVEEIAPLLKTEKPYPKMSELSEEKMAQLAHRSRRIFETLLQENGALFTNYLLYAVRQGIQYSPEEILLKKQAKKRRSDSYYAVTPPVNVTASNQGSFDEELDSLGCGDLYTPSVKRRTTVESPTDKMKDTPPPFPTLPIIAFNKGRVARTNLGMWIEQLKAFKNNPCPEEDRKLPVIEDARKWVENTCEHLRRQPLTPHQPPTHSENEEMYRLCNQFFHELGALHPKLKTSQLFPDPKTLTAEQVESAASNVRRLFVFLSKGNGEGQMFFTHYILSAIQTDLFHFGLY